MMKRNSSQNKRYRHLNKLENLNNAMAFGREPRFENPDLSEGGSVEKSLLHQRFCLCVETINKARAETGERIDLEDFDEEDVFTPQELERGESVEKDRQRLEQYRARIEEKFDRLSPEGQKEHLQREQMAKALEYIICEETDLGDEVFFYSCV